MEAKRQSSTVAKCIESDGTLVARSAPAGIGSLPQSSGSPVLPPQQAPVPQGMAPSQMSRTPMPMDMPSGGIGNVRR